MKRFLIVTAGLASALSVPGVAQVAPAAAPTCYIEIRSLMAPAPAGIPALGTAIRSLDVALRPQVLEINALKAQIAKLEQRADTPAPSTSIEAAFSDDDRPSQQAMPALDDRTAEQVRTIQTQLDTKQDKLKADYTAQQKALIGPIQEQIGRRAQAFAASKGCGALKMARRADIAALSTSGARDVTGDFVTWYSTGAI